MATGDPNLDTFPLKHRLKVEKWGLGGAAPNLQQQAQDLVQLEYGQKQRGLENAQLDAIENYNRLATEERLYAKEADPRIENIYGALQTSLGENQQANQQTYGNAIDQIRQWYDQAHGANQQLNADAMGRITADAERLGTQAALPEGTQRMTDDFLYNQSMNRNAQAGRSANMLELAAKIEALDRNRAGAAGREGAQQRASLANEVAQTLGDLAMQNYQEMRGLRSEVAGTMQDRGAAQRDALRELTQQQFENTQTGRMNALQEFLARAGLGMQRAEFGRANYEADRNYQLALEELGLSRSDLDLRRQLGLGELDLRRTELNTQTQLRREELAQDQARWEREFAEATSPEAKARAQAELDRIRAETNALLNEQLGGEGGIGGTYEPGEIGLDKYIKDAGINDTVRSAGRGIINEAKQTDDPYTFAMNRVDKMVETGFINDRDAQKLRNMLTVFFAGSGVG